MVKPGPKRQKEYSTCIKIVTLKTNWGMKNLRHNRICISTIDTCLKFTLEVQEQQAYRHCCCFFIAKFKIEN